MDLDLSHLWRAVSQRLIPLIISIIVVGLLTGAVSFYLIKPEYEATAKLLVQDKQTETPVASRDLLVNRDLLATYAEIMTSNQIVEDVISRLQLSTTVEELVKKIRIKSTAESLIFSVIVQDEEYQRAALIVNGLAETFQLKLNSIMKVDNVSILDPAKVDVESLPVRPKPFLNMAVASVLTLVMFILITVFMELTNNTIRTEEEAEKILGLPVLGVMGTYSQKARKKYKPKQETEGGANYEEGENPQTGLSG